ncbi:unnamed protein product [Brassicogethes aeneus]|uniref:Large ribosomal subunit protein bL20m n=1 Tax=Brassicogethes aeneus TaxID=1431903 RepID=A0A9P0B9H1_BRAAE|nr:unnamed protein product [Brassicogethes aeneus]
MVFTTAVNFIRARGPDEFWRKRKIFKIAAAFQGRKRNCYSIAIRYVHRALVYATKGRQLKKADMANLWETRVTAGCEEHGLPYADFREGLTKSNILLNRKTLADLACYEPHSFKALTNIAKQASVEGIAGLAKAPPLSGVRNRSNLK